jgi:hypothetical protein
VAAGEITGTPGASRARMRTAALVPLLLAACGAVTAEPRERPDAAPDAADAGPGEVSLLVRDEAGAPVGDARAVFTGSDGRLLLAAAGDAEGRIVAVVPAHTTVHVGYREELSPGFTVRRLVSVVDVGPGDVLQLGARSTTWPGPEIVGAITVAPPTEGLPAGATRLRLNLGCASVDLTGFYPVYREVPRRCLGPDDQLSVLAEATDDAGTLLARSLRRQVPFVDGGTVELPAWRAPDPELLVTAHVPPGSVPGGLDLTLQAHGVRFEVAYASGAPVGERTVYRAPLTRGYADRYQLELGVDWPADADHNASWLTLRRHGAGAELEQELALELADRLPRIAQVAYAGGALRWTLGGAGGGEEAIHFELGWGRHDGEGVWHVLAPPGTPSPLSFALYELVDVAPPSTQVIWGRMELHDVAGRDADYAFFKAAFGPWPMAIDRLTSLGEIDLLSTGADFL